MKKIKKNINCTPTIKDIQKVEELVPGHTYSDYRIALIWSCGNVFNAARLIKETK